MQTKLHSVLETVLNVFSGMLIAFAISQLAHVYQYEIQRYIWSGFEWQVSAKSNVIMTILLTLVSIGRGYSWRRFFNNKLKQES